LNRVDDVWFRGLAYLLAGANVDEDFFDHDAETAHDELDIVVAKLLSFLSLEILRHFLEER